MSGYRCPEPQLWEMAWQFAPDALSLEFPPIWMGRNMEICCVQKKLNTQWRFVKISTATQLEPSESLQGKALEC